MKKITFNQILIWSLLALMFIFMILPAMTTSGYYGSSSVSVYKVMFDGEAIQMIFTLFLSIFAMAAINGLFKDRTRKLLNLNTSIIIFLMSMSIVFDGLTGAGMIMIFLLWMFIVAVSVMDLFNIDLIGKIVAAQKARVVNVNCPGCGAIQAAGYANCVYCGVAMPVMQPQYQQPMQPQPMYQAPQQQAQAQPAQPQQTVAAVKCPACGVNLAPGSQFCPTCGAKFN